MNNTRYVSPKDSAYCPECKSHPQQERTRNHGERLCSSGHVFTLKQSRKAKTNDTQTPAQKWWAGLSQPERDELIKQHWPLRGEQQ